MHPSSNDELYAAIGQFFTRIPFNQQLGIEIDSLSRQQVLMRMPMRAELVGNFVQGILHGGAIATLLDVAGGAMALIGACERLNELPVAERMARLARLGTIDLRIDYLRPGRGMSFIASAVPLREGNKVAVVRSELHNQDGVLIAVGTGTYLCG
ncbi:MULTISPECIES: thioesterase family protein [Pseudomonas]|uniref:Medium/long-chain acyl-CoA thioesterase YigI n=1 Tax=Pseudomonas flexibilis TaxID=706570 RepID=A0A0B3BWZ3_9PSED|nr:MULTISPECIES: thioesterase family protein [Pseudomonas]KHL70357.1 putative protein PaaI, possibly involved in aromatic compounds catabolism [Pseudomonas flexibilis]KHO63932.1 hypothetical protein PT85_15745 [Pseudomonas flexibilis]SCY22745.1 uncharacterized domain 1-containing protein [Pseudomonas flexibilis]SIR19797.1 uncharacterized domain 1-containing protein [Pseudomonas flexibilis]